MKFQTLFSDERFVRTVVKHRSDDYSPIRLRYDSGQEARFLYGIQCKAPWRSRTVELGPFGLYACPELENEMKMEHAAADIIGHLSGMRTRQFVWNVRFDHCSLADCLRKKQIPSVETSTHVLHLSMGYEKTFANYNDTIRHQVDYARNNGISVRKANDEKSVRTYLEIHRKLFLKKQRNRDLYPDAFLQDLILSDDRALFLVAEFEGLIIGGALFLRDGDSMLGWHCATDLDYSKLFPTCALYDRGIQIAFEEKMSTVNLGASGGVAGLEQFKSFWGAQAEKCRRFEWTNPLWNSAVSIKRKINRDVFRKKHEN